ncbi:MAG: Hsp70 family protein [Sandaracinaceae bacterium]|nr:Hsp70 family protein [Sandaracinaceae bacterium]
MSDGPILGIDLGTTNSVVAVADGGEARVLADDEGRRMVPSVVSFQPDGPPLVGYAAREQRLLDARNTVYAVKRLIGRPFESPEVARARERFAFEIVPNKHGGSVVEVSRGTYALAEISAMVLRELRRIAEGALGESAERAVITVPANFNELQRSATKAAGKVAGLDVLRILNEPTAAALAYGYTAGQSERVAVYDLGGGTFDITILELEDDVFEVLSTAGDTFLGGEDMDRNIAEVMCDAFRAEHGVDLRRDAQAFERVKAAAEWAKCQLSSDEAVELTVEEITTARAASLDLTFAMTRAELEALATPWLDRSFQVSEEALGVAGLSIADLDRVVLVGGSTRMPLCRQRVAEFFGREPRTDLDPDLVVAQGAAIHGFALGGPREARVLRPTPAGRPVVRKPTAVGMPRQPAFAPDEQGVAAPRPPRRPARSTAPPPPVPDLPPTPPADPVLVSPLGRGAHAADHAGHDARRARASRRRSPVSSTISRRRLSRPPIRSPTSRRTTRSPRRTAPCRCRSSIWPWIRPGRTLRARGRCRRASPRCPSRSRSTLRRGSSLRPLRRPARRLSARAAGAPPRRNSTPRDPPSPRPSARSRRRPYRPS